ncbi:hypothetical protein MSIMFB_02595 [Mycobacterium simulans]|uniref:Uncharacterized protein n=1 Tax=Mycobacterium simulans TaxID=627089 RepID=A0A7Z7IK72_9MYCO|nr:hypothetical protein MSIMFB_02595 [Mycobacterium simulans]
MAEHTREVLNHWDRAADWSQQGLSVRSITRLLARLGVNDDAVFLHCPLLKRASLRRCARRSWTSYRTVWAQTRLCGLPRIGRGPYYGGHPGACCSAADLMPGSMSTRKGRDAYPTASDIFGGLWRFPAAYGGLGGRVEPDAGPQGRFKSELKVDQDVANVGSNFYTRNVHRR